VIRKDFAQPAQSERRPSGRRLENFLPEAKLLLPEIAVAFSRVLG
jgi:hypothetical protein